MGQQTSETIEAFRAEFAEHATWHWDEEWDGKLVTLCERLYTAGFEVTRIWRKGRVQARYVPAFQRIYTPAQRRTQVFERLLNTAMAADVKEITFHPGFFFVHFDMGKPIQRWKGF